MGLQFSTGGILREVQLQAVLQPLQDPENFLARAAHAADELPGMLTPVSLPDHSDTGQGLVSTKHIAVALEEAGHKYKRLFLYLATFKRACIDKPNPCHIFRSFRDTRVTSLGECCAELARCGTFLAVLLSADSAALAVWKDGEIIRQKCLTGYTVRKKAGKAQLTYLRRYPMRDASPVVKFLIHGWASEDAAQFERLPVPAFLSCMATCTGPCHDSCVDI